MRIEDMKNWSIDQLKKEVVRLSEECEKKQHDILVVVTLQGNFRPVIEGIPAVAEVMSEPRRIIKKLLCKRRRRKKVPF
mgnify:CR=1 FL=1